MRSILTSITVLIAACALLASVGLIALSTALHRTVEALGDASESIHLAETAQLRLVIHAHASNPFVRRDLERMIRQDLMTAETLITSEQEASALREARGRFEAYTTAMNAGAAEDQLEPLFAATDAAFEQLVNVNLVQARHSRLRAERWDDIANVLGVSTTVLLLTLTLWLVVWLRSRAFQPLFDLARAIRRFTEGDRERMLAETGPEELRIITRRFNELAQALSAQRRAQMAFLAGVAHDLRSPLSAMSLSVAAFPPDRPLPPEPRVRRALDVIGRQLGRVERMLGDFIDMAKIEAGELDLQIAPHDLRTLIETAVHTFESSTERHRIAVELPPQPLVLVCDGLRIEQVLNNLISNAIKYSPGGGSVHVTARGEDDEVVITVRDHGIGIDRESMPLLFEPFRRGAHGRETIPGVGLGLFVVRRIVEAHGGRIDVTSAPGEGSAFCVRLPGGESSELPQNARAS